MFIPVSDSLFFSTNMLSFLCLVTIPASQCLLTEGHLCFFLAIKFVPSRLLFESGVSQPCWLGHCYPSASLEAACRGRNGAGSDLSVSTVLLPCSGHVLDSLCLLGQALKALAALPWEGLCDKSRLSPSCLPARLAWGSLE